MRDVAYAVRVCLTGTTVPLTAQNGRSENQQVVFETRCRQVKGEATIATSVAALIPTIPFRILAGSGEVTERSVAVQSGIGEMEQRPARR